MENKFESRPLVNNGGMENIDLFGKFLSERRNIINKSAKEISLDLGVSYRIVFKWESGTIFPSEEKLPDIARVYGIELEELLNAFKISKEARQQEKDSRKNPKPIKPNPDTEAYPSGGYRWHGHF
jgi:transcriptional regulator with XRE-family HTH domain